MRAFAKWSLLAAVIVLLAAFGVSAQTVGYEDLLQAKAVSAVGMPAKVEETTGVHHKYHVECWRPDGHGGKYLVWEETFENRVPTVGLNQYLSLTLAGGSQPAGYYVGLVGSDYATASGVSNSTTTFTDSTNSPWTSADAGQPITIRGAGASGADWNGTIATYNSDSTIILSSATSTSGTFTYLFGCRVGDTMSFHSPWAEITPYSNSVRPTWTPGTVSGGSVSNSASPASFTINASAYVFGAFVATSGTKGETSSVLMGMGPFAASRPVLSGDTLNVTISFSLS